MSAYAVLFYALAAATLCCTAMALTRRAPMHAVLWMVCALTATALIFFLLGAPLLAGFQVIVYAGAIMVLFLFVVMLMRQETSTPDAAGRMAALRLARRMIRPGLLAALGLLGGGALIVLAPADMTPLAMARAEPRQLAAWVYDNAWPAVEAVSLLLLVALAGALFLRTESRRNGEEQ